MMIPLRTGLLDVTVRTDTIFFPDGSVYVIVFLKGGDFMRRSSMSSGHSKRVFSKGNRFRSENTRPHPSRGGYRL